MSREPEFIELILPYQPIIYKVCLMYANNKEDLNDLFQESLMNLWLAYPNFRSECKISSWIYRICLNTCISDLRKRGKIKLAPLETNLNVYEEKDNSQLRELYTLIKRLNKIDRALILLWLDEKNYEEIASILQLSKSNVSVRLCRVKKKLNQMSNI